MSNVTSSYYREKLNLTYLLTIIFLLIVLDISLDLLAGHPMKDMAYDLLLEGTILLVVLFTARYVWKKFTGEIKSKHTIAKDLKETKELATQWERKSKDFIKEFQHFVGLMFEEWGLSKSEKEIALLLLKGSSSKEIASVRFTSERTIRNQCRSIYEKSNKSGKSEFSAFFLNELITDYTL